MAVGLFGKLPSKGDFVTRSVPAEVLQHWEVWLEKVVSGARHHMGERWQQVFDDAPVWRFWVGEMVFGHPLAGALAPSMDRVGRRFPLTLVLTGAGADHPAPPLAGKGNGPFFDALEAALDLARSDGFDGDVEGLVAGLPLPQGSRQARAEDRRQAFFAYGEDGLARMLEDVRDHDHQLAAVARSYWWTAGNAHVGPAIVALNGMPDAAGFAALLAGFGPPQTVAVAEVETLPLPVVEQAWGDVPDSDLSWAAPIPPTPRTIPPTSAPDPWSAPAPQPDEPSPFETESGWTVPQHSALAETTPAPEQDTPVDAPPDPGHPPLADAPDAPKPSFGEDRVPDPPAVDSAHEDHESPFGLPEDAQSGAGARKGPTLRGLFSLRNRGTKGKD